MRSTPTSRSATRGEPWVSEVTYDTPFGDGYMLGTFLHRAARIGDGVIVFLHDVTGSRRMEAELVAYADVVAHDLSAPLAGIAMLVKVLELRPEEPPAPDVLQELRATSDRARELVDGVLDYARSGELVIETRLAPGRDGRRRSRPAAAARGVRRDTRRGRPPGGSRRSSPAAARHAEPRRERAEVPR